MNSKTSKRLRKLAKKLTSTSKGSSETTYVMKRTGDIGMHRLSICNELEPGCERAIYQTLKKDAKNNSN